MSICIHRVCDGFPINQQSWAVTIETLWPTKPKMFTVWALYRKCLLTLALETQTPEFHVADWKESSCSRFSMGGAGQWGIKLTLTFHWSEFSHVASPNYTEGRQMWISCAPRMKEKQICGIISQSLPQCTLQWFASFFLSIFNQNRLVYTAETLQLLNLSSLEQQGWFSCWYYISGEDEQGWHCCLLHTPIQWRSHHQAPCWL